MEQKLSTYFLHSLLSKPALALASINFLQLLQATLHSLGYPAVVLFVMIESSGIPFPGETMLLLASFYAAVYHDLSLPIVIICAAGGAIMGDNLGYMLGRTGGKALVERYGKHFFLKPERLQQAEHFFARHGDKTVFFGRFVAVLRAWAAFLAGINKMAWQKFFLYNALGGILWAIIYGLLGFYAGQIFHNNFAQVERLASNVTWILAGIILIGVVIALILYKKCKQKSVAAK
ncbi:DedA family protein [Dictyobacter arantiisoli]|uniref:VTT domain-containing protein n=1 Tax=Dictyobacter arantiisoli TaxID=2014874 RepID=A0A5A5THF9_9CHLR|nr:DedA family protein [Dictyobacter arantiisoli]GCF10404.1 hypothetical protein KDI_39680 [Dictyobacter arantiisoli]